MIAPLVGGGRGWILARLAAIGLAQAVLLVLSALVVQTVFDRFVAESTSGAFRAWGLPFVCLVGLAALMRYFERTEAERLGQQYVHAVRAQMLDRLGRASARTVNGFSRGAVMLKFVGDLSALRQWVSLGVARLGVALLTGVGTLAALAFVSWRMALLVAFAVTLPGLLIVISGKPFERSVRRARRRRGRLAGDIAERIGALAVVQAHGQVDREKRRVLRRSARLKDAMLGRAHWVGIIRALTEFGLRLGVVGALLLGVGEVAAGRLSAGGVVAGMAIVGFIAAPLRELGRAYEYWQGARVARERVADFLALPDAVPELSDAPKLRRVRGALRLEGLCVDRTLYSISARVASGARVLITGPNGSGKSTLLWCLARLIGLDAGRILLDRQDLSTVRLASVRRHIGFASADLPLLRGTIRRNITYRDPRGSRDELDAIIERCGLAPLLKDLPGGLSARIRDDGRNLSVGQRQLLILARAMYSRPRVLLLDEPDAGLDVAAGRVLEAVIDDYPGTVLIASHQAGWAQRVDEVWALDHGTMQNGRAAVVPLERPA